MKFLSFLTILPCVAAFSVSQRACQKASSVRLNLLESDAEDHGLSRREAFQTVVAGLTVATSTTFLPGAAIAEGDESIKSVVVAGATGQTGSRVYERLVSSSLSVTGGVRNVQKAEKTLKGAPLTHLDVVADSLESLVETMKGADGLVIACGMNPGKNLLRMSAAAHEVDNLGTIKLIDAAKQAGVKKVVMVSSILTDGRAWGQENSPGFVATNAFGGALDEKLEAEKHLRKAGIDYTIIRPGGLKTGKPAGALSINPENSLNSGEISRDLVADVCVASLNDAKASNKVLEIIEDEGVPPKVFNGLVM